MPSICCRLAAAVLVGLLAAPLASADHHETGETGKPRALPKPEAVQFEARDGMQVHADFYPGSDPQGPTVVLLHAHRKDRASWAPLLPDLAGAGFNLLNIDLRGHGESRSLGDKQVNAEDIPVLNSTSLVIGAVLDVTAGFAFLLSRGVQVERVGLVGASYGSLVSLATAPSTPSVRAIVMLSPLDRGFGIRRNHFARKTKAELLMVADDKDPVAVPAIVAITDAHIGDEQRIFVDKGGHGTPLLETHPEIQPAIVEFLRSHLTGSWETNDPT